MFVNLPHPVLPPTGKAKKAGRSFGYIIHPVRLRLTPLNEGNFSIFMTCAWQIAEALSQYNRVQSKNE